MDISYEKNNAFRNVRMLAIITLTYAIILPLFILLLPLSELPQTTTPNIISLVMMVLMPFELLLVYAFYRTLGPKTTSKNITGIAALMFAVGTAPAVYGFIIAFIDSYSRFFGAIMGLVFSLSGLFLAWILLNKIWDSINSQST